MKVLILCLLLFCMNTAQAEDLWEVQLYEGIGSLYDIQFIGDEGWAVGDSGSFVGMPSQILYTSNLGKQWIKRNPPINQLLFSVCFIDNKHGWVVGNSGSILYTETGGLNWFVDTSSVKNNYRSVFFRDINHGWVAGSDGNSEGILLETKDGGKLWKENELPYTVGSLDKIYFIDSLNGFLLGNSPTTIFRTSDGGDSWTYQSFDIKEGINSVHFIDKNNGWICGGY